MGLKWCIRMDCSEHASGETSACCEPARESVCVPCDCTLSGHIPVPVCLRLLVGWDLQVWRTSLEGVEDDHQKGDQTGSCRKTTSKRALRKSARNRVRLEFECHPNHADVFSKHLFYFVKCTLTTCIVMMALGLSAQHAFLFSHVSQLWHIRIFKRSFC